MAASTFAFTSNSHIWNLQTAAGEQDTDIAKVVEAQPWLLLADHAAGSSDEEQVLHTVHRHGCPIVIHKHLVGVDEQKWMPEPKAGSFMLMQANSMSLMVSSQQGSINSGMQDALILPMLQYL